MKSLTEQLQTELTKIKSSVKILTSKDTSFKMNFEAYAFAEIDKRNIDVSTFLESDTKQLKLVDRQIIAGHFLTSDLNLIADITDKWLSKDQSIEQIKNQYEEFDISDKYTELLTLTIEELTENRWNKEYESILKGNTSFNPNLFLALKRKLSRFFPFFSHDNLWFSNIVELPNENFKSPIIFCNKDHFEIGLVLGNSPTNNSFKTNNIEEAVNKTVEFFPRHFEETRNPLKE